MPLDTPALREILAQAYDATKGVPFGQYVRARGLDVDGEEKPIMRAMEMVRDAMQEQMDMLRKALHDADAQIIHLTLNSNAAIKNEIPIERQIACVRRELAMRKNVYPKWVAAKRMKQETADAEISALQATHDTLTEVQKLGAGK